MTESTSMTEITKELREMATYDCGYEEQSDIAIAAADTIDRLTAENAELLQKTQQLERENARLKIEIGNAGTICHGCPVARERTMLRSENARLTAELAEYKSTELTANEYRESVDYVLRLNKTVKQATGKTALDWEKLISENVRLTERLGMAVGDMKFVFEQKRAFADSEVLDGVDCICPLCACWLGDGAKLCDGDCNNAQWRGEESE